MVSQKLSVQNITFGTLGSLNKGDTIKEDNVSLHKDVNSCQKGGCINVDLDNRHAKWALIHLLAQQGKVGTF